jgi:hypothetical protein
MVSLDLFGNALYLTRHDLTHTFPLTAKTIKPVISHPNPNPEIRDVLVAALQMNDYLNQF